MTWGGAGQFFMTDDEGVSDFTFDGNLREFALIAFTNLLLTIATLGIYRFWAKNRVRRYLWSRTAFMGDRLEWSGTGRELFRSGVMALVVALLPLSVANLVIRYLTTHGNAVAGQVLSILVFVVFYFLAGTAIFRGLRYRLSRTNWRGIRGGSFDQGFKFGVSYTWKNILSLIPLGAMLPWAMASLWNQRWNAMSFGPWHFAAQGKVRGLWLPYLWCYVVPVAIAGMVALGIWASVTLTWFGIEPRTPLEWILIRLPAILGVILLFTLVSLAYYASFVRQMVQNTALGDISFSFNAGALDWMELYLVDFLLVVFTLGLGSSFISYRHWKFTLRNLQTDGRIAIHTVTQSPTPTPKQGEGLLDAFDMGAL